MINELLASSTTLTGIYLLPIIRLLLSRIGYIISILDYLKSLSMRPIILHCYYFLFENDSIQYSIERRKMKLLDLSAHLIKDEIRDTQNSSQITFDDIM